MASASAARRLAPPTPRQPSEGAKPSAPASGKSIVITYRVTTRAVGLNTATVIATLKANVESGKFDLLLHSAAKDDGAVGLISATSSNIIFSSPGNGGGLSGLSGAQIAGIVIGVIAFVCLVGGGAVWWFKQHVSGGAHSLLSDLEMSTRSPRDSSSRGFSSSSSYSAHEQYTDYDEDDSGFHDEGRGRGQGGQTVNKLHAAKFPPLQRRERESVPSDDNDDSGDRQGDGSSRRLPTKQDEDGR